MHACAVFALAQLTGQPFLAQAYGVACCLFLLYGHMGAHAPCQEFAHQCTSMNLLPNQQLSKHSGHTQNLERFAGLTLLLLACVSMPDEGNPKQLLSQVVYSGRLLVLTNWRCLCLMRAEHACNLP